MIEIVQQLFLFRFSFHSFLFLSHLEADTNSQIESITVHASDSCTNEKKVFHKKLLIIHTQLAHLITLLDAQFQYTISKSYSESVKTIIDVTKREPIIQIGSNSKMKVFIVVCVKFERCYESKLTAINSQILKVK